MKNVRPTCKQIILHWIRHKLHGKTQTRIFSSDVETELSSFAIKNYSKRCSASTWNRRWREVRSEKLLTKQEILSEPPQGFEDPTFGQKGWEITAHASLRE